VQCLADQFESIRLADPSQTEIGGLGGPKAMNVILT